MADGEGDRVGVEVADERLVDVELLRQEATLDSNLALGVEGDVAGQDRLNAALVKLRESTRRASGCGRHGSWSQASFATHDSLLEAREARGRVGNTGRTREAAGDGVRVPKANLGLGRYPAESVSVGGLLGRRRRRRSALCRMEAPSGLTMRDPSFSIFSTKPRDSKISSERELMPSA